MTRISFSRRALLGTGAAAAAIPFSVWFDKYGARADTPLVRYAAQSAQGQAMIAKYSGAVGSMMKQPKGNPCSWIFQWYTHAVPTNTTKAAQIASLPAAQQPLAKDMWNTCQAHGSTVGAVEDYFLPWHRMYVYFFERMVRKITGDTQWTLPYWDYTNSGHSALPQPFRVPPSSSNYLYRKDRNSGGVPGDANVNGGQPIDDGLSPTPLNTDALKEVHYSPSGGNQGFCLNLDANLHGDVHGLTGDGFGMGSVPWAANDPIFWLHHCNIDRMWASWNAGGRGNPTSSGWLTKTFVFADENCNRVVAKIDDFKAIGPLNYTYDHFEPVPGSRFLGLGNIRYLAVARLINLPIPPDPYHFALPFNEEEHKQPLLKMLEGNERMHLIVRDLSAKAAPGAIYAVYVGLPAGIGEVPKGVRPVGYLNFFDVAGMGGMEMKGEKPVKFFSFDVTDALRGAKLEAGARALNVTLVPLGKPNREAAPVLGSVELVTQTGG